jgi:FkbM family methyltransferase
MKLSNMPRWVRAFGIHFPMAILARLEIIKTSKLTTRYGSISIRQGTTDIHTFLQALNDYKMLKIRNGDTCLDLGANIGSFSLYAASKGAKVIALEPASDNYELLVRNAIGKNIIPVRMAVWKDDLGVELFSYVASKSRISVYNHFKESAIKEKVPSITLKKVIKTYSPQIIKCDIEGAELEVFKKIDQTDLGNIREMVIEYHPFSKDNNIKIFVETIKSFGFAVDLIKKSKNNIKVPVIIHAARE